ncbi:MAG TPA: MJ0042-type zinc finger domain-containing protein, partial [Telmatospirillum sp.]|nr:MJ0042-type zinc finger domain-containing protein [Telmatospirillum sp.]
MIITCPQCETHFAVSEAALGTKGRTVRCARCSHKWHQVPRVDDVDDEIPLEMPPVVSSPRAARPRETLAEHMFAGVDPGAEDRPHASKAADFGSMPAESPAEGDVKPAEDEDPFAKISELMMSSVPEPIPDVFASIPPKPAPRRKGAAGLWLLLLALLTGSAGAGLYFLQDKVIDHWPEAARYYDEFGLRNEVVGA